MVKSKIRPDNIAKINFLKSFPLLQFMGASKGGRSQQPRQAPPQATGQGGSAINVNVQSILKPKEKDIATILMIGIAYAIWLYDLSPGNYFGKPYSGFIFDVSILLNINWIGVATSAIVSLFIIYDIAMSIGEKGEKATTNYLIEMVVLAVINSASLAAYYWQAFSNPAVNFGFLAIAVLIVGYILHRRGFSSIHGADLITYWTMVLTYSFFWTLWNWTSNYHALIHMAFITFFMLFYLKKKKDINVNRLYLATSIFLLIDFFGYSFDLVVPFTKLAFPIIVLATTLYSWRFTESTFGMINGIAWTIIFIIAWAAPSQAYASEIGVDIAEKKSEGFAGFTDSISKAWEAFNLKITGRLDVATGGLYSAQVEKNQFEPLGVFLDKVRASQPRFYPDEPVTIWSSIKSRTLSDPVTVKFNCYRYDKSNNRIGIKDDRTGTINTAEGSLIPDAPFTVFTLEEKDVECTFNKDKFQPGSNPVTLSAQYNFVTSAYQEVRFIDRARHQAMIKENLDPLLEFGIKDKNPKTIYTNGPVEIEQVIQNPVTVDLKSLVLPNLGINLKNRDKITDKQGKTIGQWKGKILNIEELAIVVPKGIKIAGAGCTPVPFTEYKKEHCLSSCRKTCTDTCDEYDKDKQKDIRDKCEKGCADTSTQSPVTTKCNDECNTLFKDEEGKTEYSGYQLDKTKIPEARKSEFENIGRNTQFGCRLVLAPDVLEEGEGITRKYIRVRAKYKYLLESTYSVPVEATGQAAAVSVTYRKDITDDKYSSVYLNRANKNEVLHSPVVLQVAKESECGIDYIFLKAIIQKESNWNPAAKGDGGDSFGLMQVSSGTASALSCASNWQTDPANNVRCGCKFIKDLVALQEKKNLKPDLRNLAAAYNCGPKAMNVDTNYELFWKNPNNCWTKDRKTNTRLYVEDLMKIYNNLANQLNIDYIPSGSTVPVLANAKADFDATSRVITISWIPSSGSSVSKYLVSRYYQDSNDAYFETSSNNFPDSSTKLPGEYYYSITAVDNNYNIYGSAQTNKITIPQ